MLAFGRVETLPADARIDSQKKIGTFKFFGVFADKSFGRQMPSPSTTVNQSGWDLPPLILHPFNEHTSPSAVLSNSKAALMLSGLIPNDGSDPEDLRRRLLAGRYGEIRMLYFLGKDVFRWLEQCTDWAGHIEELRELELRSQSFAALLTVQTPAGVKEKLKRWGVVDYVSIFSRAIGLNTMFTGSPPPGASLAEEFLRNYHRYADGLYRCYMELESVRLPDGGRFHFELYASGEYSHLLETQWEDEAE